MNYKLIIEKDIMDRNELEKRTASLKLFLAQEGNVDGIIEMIKDGGNYLYKISQEFDYKNWLNIMCAWEKISKFRSDNPLHKETDSQEIIIDEMNIGMHGAIIKAFQSKNGKWVNKEDSINWRGITWMAYNMYVENSPESSDSNSFQEAVWKTVTDFTIFWCEENILEFNEMYKKI
jgi:hypothetical protein